MTAATGLDALSQLIEPYLSLRANPHHRSAVPRRHRRASRGRCPRLPRRPESAARADMAMASLLGGLALANAGLGAVHGFAGPIGGRFAAPHGAVCAALLPHALPGERGRLGSRRPGSDWLTAPIGWRGCCRAPGCPGR